MFVGEVLGKAIYDNYQNEKLFDFLQESVVWLDKETTNLSIFPLSFLSQLTVFLGFSPASAQELFEQLRQGMGNITMDKEEKYYLDQLLVASFDSNIKIPAGIRRRLMENVLLFYKLHMDTFSEVKSLKVLSQMMHGQ